MPHPEILLISLLLTFIFASGCTSSPEPGVTQSGSRTTLSRPAAGPILADVEPEIASMIAQLIDQHLGQDQHKNIAKILSHPAPNRYIVLFEQTISSHEYSVLGFSGYWVDLTTRTVTIIERD